MFMPDLVVGLTPPEYRRRYEQIYCQGPITTFDGITVTFRRSDFNHCFFKSTRRDGVKDAISDERIQRIDWIKATLESGEAELCIGYDRKTKTHDKSRRVSIIMGNYIVIIQQISGRRARFITAFLPSTTPEPRQMFSTLQKIRSTPRWTEQDWNL